MLQRAERCLPVLIVTLAALGAGIGYQQHPTQAFAAVPRLAVWSTLPALAGWLAVRPVRSASDAVAAAHRKAALLATWLASSLGMAGLARAILRGPPQPEGAAHLAPFLWPPLLCLLGLVVYAAARGLLAWSGRSSTA